MIIFNLFLTIAIILVLIMKFKAHPAVALFVGALYMGIGSGLGLTTTINTITSGFGDMMASLGFSVAFGVMLGHLLSRTGAVQVIADGIVKLFGKDRAECGMGLTGFIVSIPVFYDVGFAVLVPLAKTLSKNQKIIPYYTGALTAGLAIAHGFIPPTPGPMTAAELVGIEVGTMIFYGILVGLPTMILALTLYYKLFLNRKGFWNPAKDEDPAFELQERGEELPVDKSPSLALSLVPIFLPIAMILIGTTASALGITDNEIINFVSDKNIALFVGLLSSMVVAKICGMNRDTIEHELMVAVESIGMILFITGTGGSLATVLQTTGVGDTLVAFVENTSIPPILFAWLVAWLIKVAQGSSTVGIITACGLMAPMMNAFDMNPVLIALAAISGTLGACHVNDSGFWISAKMAGLTTSGGLKAYTLPCLCCSVVSLVIIFILSLFV